jgi:DNA-directed RNA polymerase subunit L
MNPILDPLSNDEESFKFRLSGVNVSLANGLRRTILSDIPLVIFRTSPHANNKCNIITNTSRLNNEIIKQRLSCIPIHIKDITEFPLKNYVVEVNIENNTDTILFVTTEHFIVKDVATGKELAQDKIREIFPPDDMTGYFIDFVRLRPRISDEILGEKLHLICEFDIGSGYEDGMFNSVHTCSYGNTEDTTVQDATIIKKQQSWKDEGKNEKEIQFETKNWKLLEAKRLYKKDSYDFIIQSVGIYTNNEIVDLGCKILIDTLLEISAIIEKDELEIKTSDNTMSNCFDVILENHDYTIGKVLEYSLYVKLYETGIATFCGFKKMHPHDHYSIIRLAYKDVTDKSTIKGHLQEGLNDAVQFYTKLRKEFTKLVKD